MSELSSSSDAGSHGAPSPDGSTASSRLKFSIDNILQPNFGAKSNITNDPADLLLPSAFFGLQCDELSALEQLPAWIYCTRYSDRPSAGPRCRKSKRKEPADDEKRPRTAFTPEQLNCLKQQFNDNRYLTEKRRQELAHELGLNESQIKIWFQNKRAKLKKAALQRSAVVPSNVYGRVNLAADQLARSFPLVTDDFRFLTGST